MMRKWRQDVSLFLFFYFNYFLSCLVLAKQAEKKAQEEVSKQKITKSRKRKNPQKPETVPSAKKPPPSHSIPSSSPTPSHAPSVTSLATNETTNGDYIDVVGGGDTEMGVSMPHRHGNSNTPSRPAVKRSGRGIKSNRSKKLKLSVPSSKSNISSPSNSIPSSPLSSSLFVQQQSNGTTPSTTNNVIIHSNVT